MSYHHENHFLFGFVFGIRMFITAIENILLFTSLLRHIYFLKEISICNININKD